MQQTEIAPHNLKFGVFEVDLRSGELTRLGKRVRLQGQPFQLLAMLLEKPKVLVTREELHLKLWPETTVDFDHGLNKAISKIREALGDSAENPRFIETVARRGYKFLADVTVVGEEKAVPEAGDKAVPEAGDHATQQASEVSEFVDAATDSSARPARSLTRWIISGVLVLVVSLLTIAQSLRQPPPEIRSIAVLPLENLSSDVSQDYFTDGMTDELITDLSQIHRLRVIASSSPMVNRRPHQSLREIARDLHVDAVVTGSVLFSSDRVRITARLVEMPTETDVWAQSYERDLNHTLKTQSEIARSIAEELRGVLDRQEAALKKPAGNSLVIHENYFKGPYFWKRAEEGLRRTLHYFSDAIAFDVRYAEAYPGSTGANAVSGKMECFTAGCTSGSRSA